MSVYGPNECEATEYGNGGTGIPDDVAGEMAEAFGWDRPGSDEDLDAEYESFIAARDERYAAKARDRHRQAATEARRLRYRGEPEWFLVALVGAGGSETAQDVSDDAFRELAARSGGLAGVAVG